MPFKKSLKSQRHWAWLIKMFKSTIRYLLLIFLFSCYYWLVKFGLKIIIFDIQVDSNYFFLFKKNRSFCIVGNMLYLLDYRFISTIEIFRDKNCGKYWLPFKLIDNEDPVILRNEDFETIKTDESVILNELYSKRIRSESNIWSTRD